MTQWNWNPHPLRGQIWLKALPSRKLRILICKNIKLLIYVNDDDDALLTFPSLYQVRDGSGVADASQNMLMVSPSFWMRKLGDTSPSTGGAESTQTTTG